MQEEQDQREAYVRERIAALFDDRVTYEDVLRQIQRRRFSWARRLTHTKSTIHMFISCFDVFVVVKRSTMEVFEVLDRHSHEDYVMREQCL